MIRSTDFDWFKEWPFWNCTKYIHIFKKNILVFYNNRHRKHWKKSNSNQNFQWDCQNITKYHRFIDQSYFCRSWRTEEQSCWKIKMYFWEFTIFYLKTDRYIFYDLTVPVVPRNSSKFYFNMIFSSFASLDKKRNYSAWLVCFVSVCVCCVLVVNF